MTTTTNTPDAPFRNGTSGKYRLLITSVAHKLGNYEYNLVDADGKEYHAVSNVHYAEQQLLRCMVSFDVVRAELVVTGTVVCKKQDLAVPVPIRIVKVKSVRPKSLPKPTPTPPPLFVHLDEIQAKRGHVGPMSDDEIQNLVMQIEQGRDNRKASYHCCGRTFISLYYFRRHLYECHPEEYKRFFVMELRQSPPSTVRGVGVKRSNAPAKGYAWSRDATVTPCKGDYFRLIYTPMGKK